MTTKRLVLTGVMALATEYLDTRAKKYYIFKTPQTEEWKQDKLAKAQVKRERKAKLKENQRKEVSYENSF